MDKTDAGSFYSSDCADRMVLGQDGLMMISSAELEVGGGSNDFFTGSR